MKTSKEIVFNYVQKGALIILLLFTFIGFLNPARISKHISNDSSLLKSVFYFKGFSNGFVDAYYKQLTQKEDSLSTLKKDDSDDAALEDFYSQLANMMNESSVASDVKESKTEIDTEEIVYADYETRWNTFAENNPALAEIIKFDRIACILTFVAIVLSFIGMYMSCGTGLLKKAGYIVICVGSILIALSMINYQSAFTKISSIDSSFDLKISKPVSIPVFIVFSVIAFVSSLLSMISVICKKTGKSESSVVLQDNLPASINSKGFSVTSFQITYRVVSLIMFIFLFLPAVNPARIMENISRNVSLFTSGFAYGTYTKNIERALIRGWLPRSVINLAFISSMISCIGVIVCGLASCISVGNNRLKRYAHIALLGGSTAVILSMFGIVKSYNLICTNPNVEKLKPISPP